MTQRHSLEQETKLETRSPEIIQAGSQHIRISPWKSHDSSALLTPLTAFEPIKSETILAGIEKSRSIGYKTIYTSALIESETVAFVNLGFRLKEQLYVLQRTTAAAETAAREKVRLKKPSETDLTEVANLDKLCFDDFWTMDVNALLEAESATSRSRFRIATSKLAGNHEQIVGYAITGLGNKKGYLQRLAVHPEFQSRGIGQLLVADGLEWLRFWRSNQIFVNTQIKNDKALNFYLKIGFILLHERLNILEYELNS